MKPENIKELLDIFFAKKNSKTVQSYASDFDIFRHYLGLGTVEDALIILFSAPHSQANLIILHYKTLMQEASLKSATINRRLSAIRSLVKTAINAKITPWKLDIENERIENGKNMAGPGKNSVKKILKASKKQKNIPKATRDYAIIRLLHDLALKRSSVVNLDYSDVNLEKGTIHVKISSKIKRTKNLPAITKRALTNWMDVSEKDSGPLFTNFDHAEKGNRLTGTSVYRIVRQLGKEIGIQTGPNGLRHTAITEAVVKAENKNRSLKEITAFSDHLNPKSLKQFKN